MFQAIVMWTLMALNHGGADYQANEEFYLAANVISIKDFFLDSGIYRSLCMVFRTLGFNFLQAYSIVCTIALISIFRTICRYTERRCLVLSLCMLYPFADFIIQKRNFLIVPILLYIFPFLFKRTRKGNFVFIMGCIICGLIHVTGYVYLIFFFVYRVLSIQKIKKYFCLNIMALLGAEIIFLPFLPSIASMFFSRAKVDLYFYHMTSSKIGAIYTICAHILFCVIVEYISLRCRKRNGNQELLDDLKYFSRMSILFIPLYFYGAVFARIYIYMLPYTYILFSNVYFQLKRPQKSALIIYSMVFGGVSMIALINYGLYNSGFIKLILPLFEENILVHLF